MSGLQVSYCKEIARELSKFAVSLPGAPVSVGDILFFKFGRGGFLGTRPRPWGSFELVSTLANLGISVAPTVDTELDPYIYASKGSVGIGFSAGGTGPGASATISASFRKEGSVYLAAVGCSTSRLPDQARIEVDLQAHTREILWKDTFLVTSVTTATKALIMQATSSQASFEAGGQVEGLVPGSGRGSIDANARISLNSLKDASFIKPWSGNVTVFMGLARFEKRTFGNKAASAAFTHSLLSTDTYSLAELSPQDYLEAGDE